MEFMTKPQEKELNKLAVLYANEESKAKGVFPKRRFKGKDILKLIKNQKKVRPTLVSVIKTAGKIKKHDNTKQYKTQISKEEYEKLNQYILRDLDMDSWGVATFEEKEIYKGMGIPYKNVIVMTRHMEKEKFHVETLPNMECMIEVMKVYGDTGIAALGTADFLRNMEFGAIPNHSLGGNVDYTKAGYKANLGFIGKHGMLITPHSGACSRISIVYTSIKNLNDYLQNEEDYSWGKEFCEKCGKCVRNCPYNAIYEKDKIDQFGHVESISNPKCGSGFAHYGCAICIGSCPFTMVGYEKIKRARG
ncbi:MAG: 4Fe-4S binding protein [Eubacteriales bacterium]